MSCFDKRNSDQKIALRDDTYAQGWVAKIEVWHVISRKQVASVEIPLEPSEVLLQIYQTMSLTSLQFPLAISPSCRSVIVLRTLYTMEEAGQYATYHAVDLPLDEKRSNTKFWCLPEKTSDGYAVEKYLRFDDAGSPQLARVCLYWLYFNDAGDHLCLAEQVRSCPLHMSVFQISKDGSRLTLLSQRSKWIRPFESGYAIRDDKEFTLVFHPFLPVIALAGNIGIYLWDYLSGRQSFCLETCNSPGSKKNSSNKTQKVTSASVKSAAATKTSSICHLPQTGHFVWPRKATLDLVSFQSPKRY